jgi:predicted PurR-regulated permease PerM
VFIVFQIRIALVLSFVSAMLACALHHGVDYLIAHGLKRRWAITASVAATMTLGLTVVLLLFPPAVSQGKELILHAPELWEDARETKIYKSLNARFNLDAEIKRQQSNAPRRAGAAVDPVLKILGSAVSFVGALIAVWGVTVLMLIFGERLMKSLLDEALPARRDRYRAVLMKIYRAIGGYITGLGVICGCNALCTTLFLAILRVPFFLPLGILSGLSSLVPLVGNTAAGVLISLIAAATVGVSKGIACGVFFVLYQQFENHILGPLVYRRTVNVNPLLTVIGLLALAEMGGIVGAVLAVPLLAAGQIIARELLAYRRERLHSPPVGPVEAEAEAPA